MTPFQVGDQVVCIADTVYVIGDMGLPNFKKGEILTIADLNDDPIYGLFLIFKERDPNNWGHHECFRPVVRTDISVFQAMLKKAPAPKQRVEA